MNEFLQRFKLMLTDQQFNSLTNKKVIVFGVGGVGGNAAEMLVRSGVSNLTIVDFDKVDITNINRQIVALHSTVGKLKVDVLKERLLDINPNLVLKVCADKLTVNNIEQFDLKNYDYVVDCIDDLPAKQNLIKYCYNKDIDIIVSCGAGNRYQNLPKFEVSDIKKTSYDKLAKLLRKFCVEENIKKLNVVYTSEPPIKHESNTIASVVYYPVAMACVLVSFVINQLLNKN